MGQRPFNRVIVKLQLKLCEDSFSALIFTNHCFPQLEAANCYYFIVSHTNI